MLASDEIEDPAQAIKGKDKSRFRLLTRLLRNPFSSRRQASTSDRTDSIPSIIDRRKVYMLHPEQDPPNFRLDECCLPLPGDDVIGFVDDDETVVLHNSDCPRAQRLKSKYGARIVDTRWHGTSSGFEADIKIDAIDRPALLEDLVHCVCLDAKCTLSSLRVDPAPGIVHCTLCVKTDRARSVSSLCASLRRLEGVKYAGRTH